jgi:pyruvate dehydrogenase E2 component (dihydrolipoamide acetyltransferase)
VAVAIILPKLGMAMKEGVIGKWVKDDESTVAFDETVAIIMTKKITYELKASKAGILRHRVRAQETRPVGAVIGYILAPGEALPAVEEEIPQPAPEAARETAAGPGSGTPVARPSPELATDAPVAQPDGFVVASPSARRMAREAGVELRFIPGSGPKGRVTEDDVRSYLDRFQKVLITPAARKLAEEHNLDVLRLQGSGSGGRITEADVQAILTPPAAPAQPVESPAPAPTHGRSIPFSGMRQIIAENMTSSLQTMAQLTVTTEVDVTELVDLRERLKKEFEVTYTDLIVKAVTIALKKHPRLNATLAGEVIQLVDDLHIGVGVALEEGLIVPVIRNADRLTIQQIGATIRELAVKARNNTLEIDEISGGTFTITNLGAYGIDAFTPVINPPEAAILGVGRIVEKLVIYHGDVARRRMMVLSLTFDHRLVDGAPAAAFLQTLADTLSHSFFLGVG